MINCDCGLTAGCEKCRPEWHSFPSAQPVFVNTMTTIDIEELARLRRIEAAAEHLCGTYKLLFEDLRDAVHGPRR